MGLGVGWGQDLGEPGRGPALVPAGCQPGPSLHPATPFWLLPAHVRGSPAPEDPSPGEGIEGTTPGLALPVSLSSQWVSSLKPSLPMHGALRLTRLPLSPSCGGGGSPPGTGSSKGPGRSLGMGAGAELTQPCHGTLCRPAAG